LIFSGAIMVNKTLIQCAAVLAVVYPVCSNAESFRVKPGAWEMTMTTTSAGSTMPADVMAKMPPEQRAKMESAMQARSGKPRTTVHKNCVTQKDLDEHRMTKPDDDASCTQKIVTMTATKMVMERTCAAPKASKMTMTQEAKTPESVVMTMDMQQGGPGGKIHMEMTGRWLGASCTGIERN
jgi:Protein of unknown function (DUF3617)